MIPETFKTSSKHSIILRTLLGFTLIVGFNLLSMLASMYLSESVSGDAEAINRAGSLRMQSYRLAVHLTAEEPVPASINLPKDRQISGLVQEFNDSLISGSLCKALRTNPQLNELYSQAVDKWENLMLPLIEQEPPQRRAFNFEVPLFVALLDEFVNELQLESERKLSYIRALQITSLFITVLTAFVITYSSHNKIVLPLQRLMAMARRIGKGNFTESVTISGNNELSLLAQTLNTMSIELSSLYQNLENKVQLKTGELSQSNSNLALLFHVAKKLYKTTDDPVPTIDCLLNDVCTTVGVDSVSMCLFQPEDDGSKAHTTLTTDQRGLPSYCAKSNCKDCQLFKPSSNQDIFIFNVKTESATFGTLHVQTLEGKPLDDRQIQIFTTLADFFAVALNLNKLGNKQARIALMEERAVIARELHDSLAQALSYQKIQLALLKKQLSSNRPPQDIAATIEEIQDGVSSAYRHLRELLSTFRMKLNIPGLSAGIQATIDEFSRYTDIALTLDYGLQHCPLTPNEEIHCLQIIREAVSNVIKHADASTCHIKLHQDDRGVIHIHIEDNGIGFDPDIDYSGHYGLLILKERTQSLSGQIKINDLAPGTQVHVSFSPSYTYGYQKRNTANELYS